MRRVITALLLGEGEEAANTTPTPKEPLTPSPAGARHYEISSTAGEHGDVWWSKQADGRVAYRMSIWMSLRRPFWSFSVQ